MGERLFLLEFSNCPPLTASNYRWTIRAGLT